MYLRFITKEYTAYLIAFDILYHAFQAVFKHNYLAVHGMFHTVNCCDTVTYADNCAYLFAFSLKSKSTIFSFSIDIISFEFMVLI